MTDAQYPALLDEHQAIAHLRAVVAEFGAGYIYVKPKGHDVCIYVHTIYDGDSRPELVPGCIVAKVLHRHGVPMNVLSQYEGLGASQLGDPTSLVRRGVATLVTGNAGIVLSAAQNVQDAFKPWGKALAAAEDRYAEMPKVAAR